MNKMETAKNTFNKVMGVEVELTIRGERKFTISFEGRNDAAVKRLKTYLGDTVEYESLGDDYDEECDMTCIFFTATAK